MRRQSRFAAPAAVSPACAKREPPVGAPGPPRRPRWWWKAIPAPPSPPGAPKQASPRFQLWCPRVASPFPRPNSASLKKPIGHQPRRRARFDCVPPSPSPPAAATNRSRRIGGYGSPHDLPEVPDSSHATPHGSLPNSEPRCSRGCLQDSARFSGSFAPTTSRPPRVAATPRLPRRRYLRRVALGR